MLMSSRVLSSERPSHLGHLHAGLWLDGPVRAPRCKNRPAPFPGRMSYKATKPGLVSVLYLSMRYTVQLLFIRAPFYVSLVFAVT